MSAPESEWIFVGYGVAEMKSVGPLSDDLVEMHRVESETEPGYIEDAQRWSFAEEAQAEIDRLRTNDDEDHDEDGEPFPPTPRRVVGIYLHINGPKWRAEGHPS